MLLFHLEKFCTFIDCVTLRSPLCCFKITRSNTFSLCYSSCWKQIKTIYTLGFFNSKRLLFSRLYFPQGSLHFQKWLSVCPNHQLLGPILILGRSHSSQELLAHDQADSSSLTAQIPCLDPNKSTCVPAGCGNPYPKPWRNWGRQCLSPHQQAAYFVIESNQVCQAHSDLGESLLTFPHSCSSSEL